jgi:glycosyltransferase involved in cell wall biosynthesis
MLSSYRVPFFVELAERCQVDVFFSPAPPGLGFGEMTLPDAPNLRCFQVPSIQPLAGRLGTFQRGLLGYILRQRPDALLLSANLRNLSFWGAVVCARLLGIPVYAHGHGPFKKKRIGVVYRRMMQAVLRLVTGYICYAPAVRQSFLQHGFGEKKLAVAHNSLANPCRVRPEEKSGGETGVLFIGRLRKGSNLPLLIRVIGKIRDSDRLPLRLHVIGAGVEEAGLREAAGACPWVVFHGEIYDAEKIRAISLACFLGCYPGNAGLSVVHMMSLSLPVVTHNQLWAHGPEPSFIRDEVSGWLYDHADADRSLQEAIRTLACDPARVARMQEEAFADYQSLTDPSLAERFWTILRGGETVPKAFSGLRIRVRGESSGSEFKT